MRRATAEFLVDVLSTLALFLIGMMLFKLLELALG